jgi:hypothetical protein
MPAATSALSSGRIRQRTPSRGSTTGTDPEAPSTARLDS